MPPHVGAGGGTPSPRNDSPASARITAPTRVVNSTMTTGMTFGRMWRLQDVQRARTHRLRCMGVHVFPHGTHGAPHDAGAGNPVQQAEDQHDLRHAWTDDGHHHDQQHQIRKCHPRVHESLDQHVDTTAQ
jgi:hypothetical protein